MKQIIDTITSQSRLAMDAITSDNDAKTALLVFAAIVIVVPFDTTQLLLLLLGASLAAIGQYQQKKSPVEKEVRIPKIIRHKPTRLNKQRTVVETVQQHEKVAKSLPRFAAPDFAGQVDELVLQLEPDTHSSAALMSSLSRQTSDILRRSFPDVKVLAVASGDISRNSAFAVAVPEVHLIITGGPVLSRMLEQKARTSDTTRANKAAVQSVVSILIQNGGFKFRRSAFRTAEPKVTLLAPSQTEDGDGVVLDVVVNSFSSLQERALIDSCQTHDPRARALILLVRRWAKYRGLCHTSQGHLSPHVWSLLAVKYMQERNMLPKIETVSGTCSPQVNWSTCQGTKNSTDVSMMFAGFFEWISDLDLLNGSMEVLKTKTATRHGTGLCISDPFNPSHNLASSFTPEAHDRVQEEIVRMGDMLARKFELSALLERDRKSVV